MPSTDERAAAAAAAVATIRSGDLDGPRRLIEEWPDVVTAGINGRTALHGSIGTPLDNASRACCGARGCRWPGP